MNVTLIGMGSGQPENLTLQGLAALRQADLILGARRLLAVLPAGCTENRAAAYRPDEVAELLQTSGAENAVLVYSGDTGFYSGASSMMEKLEALGVRARVLPGLSSIQLLAAALGRPWQGWNLVSAHGRTCDPVAECMQGRPTFFLTGGSEDPATLCAQLAAEGLGIAFNFESYIRHFHYHKPVRWFYVGDRETVINYSIIYRRDKYMPTYVKDLIAALQEALELDTGR